MNDDRIKIKHHLNENPQRNRIFTIRCFDHCILVTVTSTPAVVREWIYNVRRAHRHRRHRLVVGLGVQWRPTFTSELPQPATLQLSIGGQCLIYQLLHTTAVPLALRRFLTYPLNTFVGVSKQLDEKMLLRSKHKLSISKLLDIRDIAESDRGISRNISMERLAELLLGLEDVKKPKKIGMSNWDTFWLTEEQVQYACVDAFLSFLMGKKLHAWSWEGAVLDLQGPSKLLN